MKSQNGSMLGGFTIGILIGAGVALFKGPRFNLSNRLDQTRIKLTETSQSMKNLLEDTIYSDPVIQSIEAGREAARRRRSELGLES